MILELVPECTYDEYQREDWETVSIHCIQTEFIICHVVYPKTIFTTFNFIFR